MIGRTLARICVPKTGMSSSTLLIPESIADELRRRMNARNLCSEFDYLVRKYGMDAAAGRFGPCNNFKGRVLYQEPDQNLVSFHFRPREHDWLKLGEIAGGLGVSRCRLFVMFLLADMGFIKLRGKLPGERYHLKFNADWQSASALIHRFEKLENGLLRRGIIVRRPRLNRPIVIPPYCSE